MFKCLHIFALHSYAVTGSPISITVSLMIVTITVIHNEISVAFSAGCLKISCCVIAVCIRVLRAFYP